MAAVERQPWCPEEHGKWKTLFLKSACNERCFLISLHLVLDCNVIVRARKQMREHISGHFRNQTIFLEMVPFRLFKQLMKGLIIISTNHTNY